MSDDTPTTLAELANRHPDELALADDHQQVTWAELDALTHRIGNGYEAVGLVPGDHVAVVATNRVEFVISMLAALRAGMTMTPVKTNWTATEIAYVLQDASSRVVVTDVDPARRAATELGLPIVDLAAGFDEWVAHQDPSPLPQGRTGYRIPYTSGTTGRPKGVRREQDASTPFETWWTSSGMGSQALGLPRDGVHLMVSQLFHGAPLAFGLGALAAGAPMRIMTRWNADAAIDLLNDGVTASIMVPTMFRQLLALPEERRAQLDPSGFTCILHGGESCPVELKQKMIDWWGPVFVEYYGFTEGGMALCTTAEWLERPGTVGKPMGAQEVLIVDENGEVLGPHQDGTVYFRRPEGRAAFRYLNADDKTDAAFRADGAFTVGDIGHVDEDGYLFLSGRSAELIVSAGVNVYPAEIESVIFEVEGVADAVVAGGPDDERGEHAVAFISVAPGTDPAAVVEAVEAACAEHLAGYKRPRRIEVRDEIPRDPTGKVLRTAVRKELWEGA
ncbi:MAG: AMP-binding protein [Acidimicrobiales bacterium]|nr:AMP-binding protein [Acidimicrobiales bacterium]